MNLEEVVDRNKEILAEMEDLTRWYLQREKRNHRIMTFVMVVYTLFTAFNLYDWLTTCP